MLSKFIEDNITEFNDYKSLRKLDNIINSRLKMNPKDELLIW